MTRAQKTTGTYDTTPIAETERFVEWLRYLHARGGRLQMKRTEIASALDIGSWSARRIIDRAVELGVIRIERGHPGAIGQGSIASTYVLLMTPDQFIAQRDALVARAKAERDARKGVRQKGKQAPRSVDQNKQPRQPPPESTLPPLPSAEAIAEHAGDQHLDVDAWADAVDFDGY